MECTLGAFDILGSKLSSSGTPQIMCHVKRRLCSPCREQPLPSFLPRRVTRKRLPSSLRANNIITTWAANALDAIITNLQCLCKLIFIPLFIFY